MVVVPICLEVTGGVVAVPTCVVVTGGVVVGPRVSQ